MIASNSSTTASASYSQTQAGEEVHKAESQVIQLADILVGSVSQRLDNSSAKEGKVEAADFLTDMALHSYYELLEGTRQGLRCLHSFRR